MEPVAQGWKITVGGGAVLTVLAQTKPDDAISNLGAWVKLVGIDAVPPILLSPRIDTFATVAGVLTVAIALFMWRREVRHVHHKEITAQAKGEASVGVLVTRSGGEWTPLPAALRYLVYESEWGHQQAKPTSVAEFDRLVAMEFRERLARGEVRARGAKGEAFSNPERPTEDISSHYWQHGTIQPHAEIQMEDSNRAAAWKTGSNDTYRRVIISTADLASTWPGAGTATLSSLASFVEPSRKLFAESVATEARFIEGARKRRQELIAKARDLAQDFGDGETGEGFRAYLEGQRVYADIRPHLSPEYLAKLNAQRMLYAKADGAKYPTLVSWFLDDIDRLEKEWGLI